MASTRKLKKSNKKISARHKTYKQGVQDAIKAWGREISERIASQKNRSPEEQNIIGNLLTSVDIESKKRARKLYEPIESKEKRENNQKKL